MQSRDTYQANFRNTPWPELIYANTVKRLLHHFPGKNEIILQGLENIPAAHPVLFVIDKPNPKLITDFVYSILKYNNIRYTSYWIPDHILHYPLWRKLFNWGNAIPTPTRAIFVQEDFVHKTGRKPSPFETKVILNLLDGQEPQIDKFETGLKTFFKNNKNELAIQTYRDYFDSRYSIIIKAFINSHRRAIRDHNLNVMSILNRDIKYPETLVDKALVVTISALFKHTVYPIESFTHKSESSKSNSTIFQIKEPIFLPELINKKSDQLKPEDILEITNQLELHFT